MNDNLLLLINGWAGNNSLLDNLMIFCAKYLVYIVFLVVIGCIGLLVYKKQIRPVFYFFATLVASYVLLKIMAMTNLDHRPFMDYKLTQLISHEPGKSFPSDHTTVTAALAMGMLLFTKYKKVGVVILVCAVVIGFARIFVGVHYPLDILGGLFAGVTGGLIVFIASKPMDKLTLRKRKTTDKNQH